MKLHKAIKEIVASKGAEMINNIQIINYLLDYQAFKDKPATKLILRDIINSGYAESILSLSKQRTGWQMEFAKYQYEFIDSCGYKEELAAYVFEAIAYGLGLNVSNEEPEIKSAFNVDSFFEIPEVARKPQSQLNPSQQAPQVAPTDLYTISLSFFKEGKYQQAKGFIEKAITHYSNSNIPSSYLKLMGDIEMYLACYQEAINYYNECFKRKAVESHMSVDDLRDSLKQHIINGFENSIFCYFFCLHQAKGINDAQWLQLVKAEARYGLLEAIKYCADNGINPVEDHFDIYFSDKKQLKTLDYLFEDGSFAHEKSGSKKAIARIVLTTTSTYEQSKGWHHGYIIPLEEVRSNKLGYNVSVIKTKGCYIRGEAGFEWSKNKIDLPFPYSHYTIDDLNHWNEIQKVESEHFISDFSESFPAFHALSNYHVKLPILEASQWFLPSIHTIKRINSSSSSLLYLLGGNEYWTSSQADENNAISIGMYGGKYNITDKNEELGVLPVAAF